MIRHKICGIRSAEDAAAAVNGGVTAIGVICGTTHRSEDELTPDLAAHIVRLVPASITTVLVTHLTSPREIVGLADTVGADVIQLHGEISLATAALVRRTADRPTIKAIHVTGPDTVAAATDAALVCDALLLDSRTETRLGGTGLTHDWSISRRIVEHVGRKVPVILAGGLTPTNLRDAIDAVQPDAVDVNSGVDDSRGDKARALCGAFVAEAEAFLPPRAAAAATGSSLRYGFSDRSISAER